MNLFELFVKIGVDDQASDKVGKIAEKLGNGLKTAAKVGTAAVAGTSAAIVALGTQAIDQYAEYEQLVGGVETLFGTAGLSLEEYAKKEKKTVAQVEKEYKTLERAQSTALKNASAAYKTAGMSANDYMSTITSFAASLIQSLEGDTEAAVAAADLAITDMSDNANKMGTDMSLIQNAYQGFAKANYTMLDNLKLGYGGTQTEMQRLIKDAAALSDTVDAQSMSFANIVEAIHVVQTEMGITGTTAKEAGATISGSVASMKAAWQNMLVGIADENADFEGLVDDFITTLVGDGTEANKGFFGNIIPRVDATFDGIGKLVQELAPEIAALLPDMVAEAGPALAGAAADMIQSFLDSLVSLTSGDKSGEIKDSGGGLLLRVVEGIASNLDKMLDSAAQIISNLVDGLTSEAGKDGETNRFMEAAEKIIEAIGGFIIDSTFKLAEGAAAIIKDLVEYFEDPENQKKIEAGVTRLGDKIVEKFKAYDWSQIGEWIFDHLFHIEVTPGSIADKIISGLGGNISEDDSGAVRYADDHAPVNPFESTNAAIHAIATGQHVNDVLAEWYPSEERVSPSKTGGVGRNSSVPSDTGTVNITQNIYSQAQTAADLAEATLYEAERGILSDVPR